MRAMRPFVTPAVASSAACSAASAPADERSRVSSAVEGASPLLDAAPRRCCSAENHSESAREAKRSAVGSAAVTGCCCPPPPATLDNALTASATSAPVGSLAKGSGPRRAEAWSNADRSRS